MRWWWRGTTGHSLKRPAGHALRGTTGHSLKRPAGVVAALFAVTLAAASCSSSSGVAAGGNSSALEAAGQAPVWLCRPGLAHDPCTANLTTTVVEPGGTTTVQRASPAANPPIDCFYVYPTVSAQTTANANLTVDPEETAIAIAQVSRFSTACRVYAPMYRQLTLSAITGSAAGAGPQSLKTAYSGVLAAWRYYLAHDNHGRGVVFIGHSQGASMLIRLLRSQVDPNAAERRLLVSALIMGGNVTVPVGASVGGDFRHIPACRSTTQTGCVVAYSSFDQPPPANSLFGRPGTGVSALSGQVGSGPQQVLCVNPASLSDPSAARPLEPYFPVARFPGPIGVVEGALPTEPTPWVSYPNRYTAQCENAGGASWLQVSAVAAPGDTRPVVTQVLGPAWGLHLADVNLALGNLVALVHDQSVAYTGR